MSSTLSIARQRHHRRQRDLRSGRQRAQRMVLGLGFGFSAALVVTILVGVFMYAGLSRDLPSVEAVPALLDSKNGVLLQPTRLYDRTGDHLLAVLSPTDASRTFIPYNRLPASLVNATIAVSQPNFWASPGYTFTGWRDPSDHSTLAQILAYELLLWDAPASPVRAIHERMLAGQITSRYGRQQVIEWFLNSADYGHYAYGVEAASRLYLGKSAAQLDLGEAALLAAIGEAPALNPLDVPQGIEERRILVLQAMMEQGLITPAETAAAVKDRPKLLPALAAPGSGDTAELAPAFVHYVLSQLGAQYGAGRVERGGLAIYTSLDYGLQLQAECVLRTELARLTGSTQTIQTRDKTSCEAARLLPPLQAGQTLPDALASVLFLDPQNGQVLAEVGDMGNGLQANTLEKHPAGTVITPFIYLTGFSRGLSPASLTWDIPGSLASDGQIFHGPVRLRTALANDYLTPAVNLLDQMSQESVENIGSSFGLQIPAEVHLLQDDFGISPLTLAGAYAVFANSGVQAGQAAPANSLAPVSVLKIVGTDHSTWADRTTSQTRSVVSPQLAYVVDQVLSDETARWPSLGHPNPLEIGRPAGAKISPPWTCPVHGRLDILLSALPSSGWGQPGPWIRRMRPPCWPRIYLQMYGMPSCSMPSGTCPPKAGKLLQGS